VTQGSGGDAVTQADSCQRRYRGGSDPGGEPSDRTWAAQDQGEHERWHSYIRTPFFTCFASYKTEASMLFFFRERRIILDNSWIHEYVTSTMNYTNI
jgi:hypothetical protein